MKQRNLMIVAIACGLACAACIALFMVSVQGEANAARAEALARYGGEQVEVCVATRDVASGERMDASAVETRLWIADLLPENAVRDASEVMGKTVASPILKGEVITTKRFENSHNALDIPAGKAAVSVPAKAVQAVGGAISAGMSVDVYSSGDTTTTALASGVIVLDTSVGESNSLVSSESGWITLAVEPDRVQEIITASNKTSLYFVLPGEKADDVGGGASKAAEPVSDASPEAPAKPDKPSEPQKEKDSGGQGEPKGAEAEDGEGE